MIKLAFSQAVAIYLFFSVVVILVLWTLFEYRRGAKKYPQDNKHIWHCSICEHTYIDSKHEDLSQCPMCGSYIEREKGGG